MVDHTIRILLNDLMVEFFAVKDSQSTTLYCVAAEFDKNGPDRNEMTCWMYNTPIEGLTDELADECFKLFIIPETKHTFTPLPGLTFETTARWNVNKYVSVMEDFVVRCSNDMSKISESEKYFPIPTRDLDNDLHLMDR